MYITYFVRKGALFERKLGDTAAGISLSGLVESRDNVWVWTKLLSVPKWTNQSADCHSSQLALA